MNLLRKLLGLCEHDWEPIDQIRVYSIFGEWIGIKYICRCTRCNKMKSQIV